MAKNFNSVDIFIDMLEENRLSRVILVSILWFFWFYGKDDGSLTRRRKAIIATILGTMAAVLFTVMLTDVLPYRFRPVHDPDLKTKLKFVEDSKYVLQGLSAFPSDTATLIGGFLGYHRGGRYRRSLCDIGEHRGIEKPPFGSPAEVFGKASACFQRLVFYPDV